MMDAEIREAMARLNVLGARWAASPDLAAALRRALVALEGAARPTEPAARAAALDEATAALGTSLELMQQDGTEVDQQQLGAAAGILGLIHSVRERLQRAPRGVARPGSGAGARPVDDHEAEAEPAAAEVEAPSRRVHLTGRLHAPSVDAALSRLVALHVRRSALLRDPMSTVRDLRGVELRIREQARVLFWDEDRVRAHVEAIGRAPLDEAQRLRAVVALAHAADRDSTARAFDLVHGLLGARDRLATAVDALRLAAGIDAPRRARALFQATTNRHARALLIPALLDWERLGPADLLRAIDDRDDDVAATASAALAWTDERAHARALLDKARATSSPARAEGLLLAAVALGAAEALVDIRARLRGGASSEVLLDAIAVAGDPDDLDLLLDMVGRGGLTGMRAALALGHLGDARGWSLVAAAPAVNAEAVLEIRLALFGDADPELVAPGRRVVGGKPWSVRLALDRATGDQVPLALRRWAALDLVVRTGYPSPVSYDAMAPCERQEIAAAALSRRFESEAAESLKGRWLYFGRPRP